MSKSNLAEASECGARTFYTHTLFKFPLNYVLLVCVFSGLTCKVGSVILMLLSYLPVIFEMPWRPSASSLFTLQTRKGRPHMVCYIIIILFIINCLLITANIKYKLSIPNNYRIREIHLSLIRSSFPKKVDHWSDSDLVAARTSNSSIFLKHTALSFLAHNRCTYIINLLRMLYSPWISKAVNHQRWFLDIILNRVSLYGVFWSISLIPCLLNCWLLIKYCICYKFC